MSERWPMIAEIEKSLADAHSSAIVGIKSTQESCPHDRIVANHRNGFGGRRICVQCGLEEANNYSWPGHTVDGGLYEFMRPAGLRTILNSEYVKIDDVTKYRVRL